MIFKISTSFVRETTPNLTRSSLVGQKTKKNSQQPFKFHCFNREQSDILPRTFFWWKFLMRVYLRVMAFLCDHLFVVFPSFLIWLSSFCPFPPPDGTGRVMSHSIGDSRSSGYTFKSLLGRAKLCSHSLHSTNCWRTSPTQHWTQEQ